jgi:arylformamidase
MDEKVFLNYSQSELDRNYDQRGWISNAEEMIARYAARSEKTRRTLIHRPNVPYGESPDEVLDIFPAANPGAPSLIFFHGGAWRNFTKDDFSFVADTLVPAGVHVIVVNFSKLPQVSLPVVVAQTRRAIVWVARHAQEFKSDSEKLYLCGHSSGAHLAAMVLLTDWTKFRLFDRVMKGATCISGSYDLKPVLLSSRASYLKLSPSEEHELSPARHTAQIRCPILVAYAEHDTDEFQRHSREFADSLGKARSLSSVIRLPETNHFEIIERLTEPESTLMRAMLTHIGETTSMKSE